MGSSAAFQMAYRAGCMVLFDPTKLKSVNHKYSKAVRVQVAVLQKDEEL